MLLNKLHIVNYKNYEDVQIECHPDFNVITGLNGMGKTNLIDAIYYLALTRSYFLHTDTHNYRHNMDFFRISGDFKEKKKKINITAKLKKRATKVIERNKKKYTKLIDHVGLIPIVMIAPKDHLLISEGSEERRRMMDTTLSQLDNKYIQSLAEYKYVLKQRNQLLKDHAKNRSYDLSVLDIYDAKLSKTGEYIFESRKEYLEYMKPVFKVKYELISGAQESCDFKYKSNMYDHSLADLLKQSREKDLIMQRTTEGIHKDDLVFFNEEKKIRYVGSQGQQKSFILSLKLAQYELLHTKMEKKPIILLDDIFDKLDSKRVLQLIKLLKDHDLGQIFITDTEKERLKKIFAELNYSFSLFEVKDNKVNIC